MELPTLSAADKESMKRYFAAARLWDAQRRQRIADEPNDPARNRAILNHLISMARRAGPEAFVDGPQEDEAETRVARVLSGRPPHPSDRRGAG